MSEHYDDDQRKIESIVGMQFLVALPDRSGRIVGLCSYRGKVLIATEFGHLYEWDGDLERAL